MLDAIKKINIDKRQQTGDVEIDTRIAQYEMAYRMQSSVPELTDISKEPQPIIDMYGEEAKKPGTFAANCLLARRMAERGVKFTQIFIRQWDQHGNLPKDISRQCKIIDQPSAALVKDLKQRGMLDDTLVVWTGEFGRTPDNNRRGGVYALGRGHNVDAMTMLMAGGGVKKGAMVGATDEIGAEAAEVVHPIRDLHVTLLHLLGLDDNKLTYFHGGRYKQLSQFGGEVIKELIA